MDFASAYARLNDAQKDAVDTIYGPVAVIAGPGTGKTQVLAMRIANILQKSDLPPESILAIAFSESAVTAMRERLRDLIGPTAYRVTITTFHAFANTIIQRNPELFADRIGSAAAHDLDRIATLEEVLHADAAFDPFLPKGNPAYYIPSLLSTFQELKREAVSPDELRRRIEREKISIETDSENVHEKGAHKGKMKATAIAKLEKLEKTVLLALAYERYEAGLANRRLYDFEDMLIWSVEAIAQNPGLRDELRETYQFILIDEHQDTNEAQNKLIEAFTLDVEQPNIFVVGDEKQAIYRFQGASIENFLRLPSQLAGTKIISLTDNYRSMQPVLDASHAVIGSSQVHKDIPRPLLKARRSDQKKSDQACVSIHECAHPQAEAERVADDISKFLKNHETTEKQSVAIIYRNNAESERFGRALEAKGIQYAVSSAIGTLESVEAQRLLSVLQAYHDPHEDEYVAQLLLSGVLTLDIFDALSIIRHAKEKKQRVHEVFAAEQPALYAHFNEGVNKAHALGLLSFLDFLYTDSMVLAPFDISPTGARHSLAPVAAMFMREAEYLVTKQRSAQLKDFCEHLKRLGEHSIESARFLLEQNREHAPVRLMTAHRSKGLEFERVYVVGCEDGRWGGKRSRSLFYIPGMGKDEQDDADERRLFYVALTRAKDEVHITYSRHSDEGKTVLPSRFISEIPDSMVSKITHDSGGVVQNTTGANKADTGSGVDRFTHYVRDTAFGQALSVTALNNSIECPWRYIAQNVLRLPYRMQPHLIFGVSIHAALAHLCSEKVRALPADQQIETVNERFLRSLNHSSLEQHEYDRYLRIGPKVLAAYIDAHPLASDHKLHCEYETHEACAQVVRSDGTFEWPLTGKIDRIDMRSMNLYSVIDYKTGKPKSRNEILGKTADSNGGIFRQLAFYKLLLEQDPFFKDKKYEHGIIQFIESSDQETADEAFEVDGQAVAEVVTAIQTLADRLESGKIIHERCEDADCQYCAFGSHLLSRLQKL